MPPTAIASSELRHHVQRVVVAGVRRDRSTASIVIACGNLGPPEAASRGVVLLAQRRHRAARATSCAGAAAAGCICASRPMASVSCCACSSKSSRRCSHVVHRLEDLRETRHAVAREFGKYVPPKNGRPSGVEEHRHRPAAPPDHRLHGIHVDRVHVGTLLAIDLHVDEELVHDRGGRSVFERLVRHDVTPVARGVADRQQDRSVFGPRRANASSPHGNQSTGLSAC